MTVAITAIEALGLGRLTRVPSHKRAAKIAPQLFAVANKASGDGVFEARAELQRLSKEAATAKAKAIYQKFWDLLPANRRKTTAPAARRTAAQEFEAETGVSTLTAAQLALQASRGRSTGYRTTTQRVLQGYDDFGQPIYRSVRRRVANRAGMPSGARSGRLPGASGLATAGVVIGGLAAGYYIGKQLNTYLAGRALNAERAGVQAALAFRKARADAAAAKGTPLTAAEVRSLGDVYQRQLSALGYDPHTFTRKRSTVERFFTGEEETDEGDEE